MAPCFRRCRQRAQPRISVKRAVAVDVASNHWPPTAGYEAVVTSRVGLVFNPFSYKLHEENLRIVQRYFGLFPPLSLAWVAAVAEQAGHEVVLIDARTLRLSKEEVLERLKYFQPDILGFMMTTYMYRETLEWARYLKKHLKVPVMIGGYNLRVYPRASVVAEEVDFGCLMHAITTVPGLLAELEGGRNFGEVPGLVWKRGDEVIVNPLPPKPPDFNDFPVPARHLLPNELYAEFPTERRNFTVLVSSLGCPYGCTFCEAGRTPHSPRRPELVVDEMEQCYREFGIREIDIFDYEFPCNNKRTLAICKDIQRRNLDIIWACRSRLDSVNRELLEEMAKAGCRRIYYGIESAVDEILETVNKPMTKELVRQTIQDTQEVGIRPLGFFLVGAPGETQDTFGHTLDFAKELDLDYVQFSKCTAKPLTPLWQDLVRHEGQDYWRNYILGLMHEQALPRPWTELTNEQIDALAKHAYTDFHFRPKFILKSILKLRSWTEFKRKFYAALEMFMRQEKHAEDWDEEHDGFIAYNENTEELRLRLKERQLEALKASSPQPKARALEPAQKQP